MKQIQFYFMCLLLTLSIHTVYSSQPTNPIFNTTKMSCTNTHLSLICTPAEVLRNLNLLKFQQDADRRSRYLIVNYLEHTQIIDEGLDFPALKLTDPIIDTNRRSPREIQFIFPYQQT